MKTGAIITQALHPKQQNLGTVGLALLKAAKGGKA